MSLYLPPELRWLGWIAGGAWPDGDEDKIWAVSSAYKDTATALRSQIPDIEDAKRTAVSAYPEGAGGEKIGAMFDQLLKGDQSMESLASFMEQISDATFDFGTQVEAAKLMTIVSLIALAIEIAWAWAFPPTAPAVQAAEEVATQSILRRLEWQLQERIIAKVLSVFGNRFAGLSKNWVLKILEAMFISGGLDLAVQLGQKAAGHRRNIDGKELGVAIFSAGVGAPFGRIGANGINKFTTKFFGDKFTNPWVRAGNGAIVGIGGGALEYGAGSVGAALITGDWSGTLGNPAGWVGGAARGGITGGVKGYVGFNQFGNKSFGVDWRGPRDGSADTPVRGGFSFDPGRGGSHNVEFNGGRNGFDGEHVTVQGSNGSGGDGRSVHPAGWTGDNGSGRSNQSPNGVSSYEPNGNGTNRPLVTTSEYNGDRSGGSGQPGSTQSGNGTKVVGVNGDSYSSSPPPGRSTGVGSDRGAPSTSNPAGRSGDSYSRNDAAGSRPTSSANSTGGGRDSSVISGSTDRISGDSGQPLLHRTAGSDGSLQWQRQTPGDGFQTPSRSTAPEPNIAAGQSHRSPGSVSDLSSDSGRSDRVPGSVSDLSSDSGRSHRSPGSVSDVSSSSGQPPRSSNVSDTSSTGSGQVRSSAGPESGSAGSGHPRSSASESGSTGSGQSPRSSAVPDTSSAGSGQPRSSMSETGSSGSGQPPRSSVPETGSTGSGQPPRSTVVSETGSTGPGQSPRSPGTVSDLSSNSGQSPRAPGSVSELSSNSGQPSRSSAAPDTGSAGSGHPRSSAAPESGASQPQRSPVPDTNSSGSGQPPRRPMGLNLDGQQQHSPASETGSNNPRQQRHPAPNTGLGDDTSQPRRTSAPATDSGNVPPSRQRPSESGSNGPGWQRLPSSSGSSSSAEGDRPAPRAAMLPAQPDHGGQRGHDAESSGRGGWTFEADQNHPNWTRTDRGDALITSPDGTEHIVDKNGNIFLARPGDDTVVLIRPDNSVEFLPNDGKYPVAEAGPRTGTGRDGDFGFGRDDGTQHTVLGDGTVRTTSPDGSITIIKRDGGAELRSPWDERTRFEPDGTVVPIRPDEPTTDTTPGNTVPNDKAEWKREGDGKFLITSPDGTRHEVGADGAVLVGRPGDPQLLKIDTDHSIVFVGPDGTGPSARPDATTRKGSGVQSPTFTRPDQVSHTVLDNGSVRTKSPDGWTTIVRPNGTAEFTSPTGDRTLYKPDNTVVESGPDRPTVITGPDGTKQTIEHNNVVTIELPDSTKHVVFDATDAQGGGRTQHPDNTVIHYDLNDTLNIGPRDRLGGFDQDGPRKPATIQMERPDGIGLESTPKGVRVFDGDGTVYERGPRGSVRVTTPNGQTESRPINEPIELSNGAQLERTPKGLRVVHPDESVSEIGPNGASFTDSNGVARGTHRDGTAFVNDTDVREIRGDGAVRVTTENQTAWGSRPDGTTWTVDDKNKVHVSDPEGAAALPADPKNPYVDGQDLTAKPRPPRTNKNEPMPDAYRAPTAPGTEDWLPEGFEEQDETPPDNFLWDPPNRGYWVPPDWRVWRSPGSDDWRPPGPDNEIDYYDYGSGPAGDQRDWDDDRGSGQGSGYGGGDGTGGGPDRVGDNGFGDSGARGGSGRRGSGDEFGDSGSADGSGDGFGDSGATDADGRRGSGGDSSAGESDVGRDGSAERDATPPPVDQEPPPPQLDPAELANMLQNLHSADGMLPPGGIGGSELPGEGERSPDFSRLLDPGSSSRNAPPPDLSALRGMLNQLGENGLGGPGGTSSDSKDNSATSRGRPGSTDQYGNAEHPGAGRNSGTPDTRVRQDGSGSESRSGGQGFDRRPDGRGADGRFGGQDADRRLDGRVSDGRFGGQGAEGRLGGQGSDGRFGGQGSEGLSGDQGSENRPNGQGSENRVGDNRHGDGGTENRSDGKGSENGSPSDVRSPAHGAENRADAPGATERTGDERTGERSGGTGTGDQATGQGTGERHGAPGGQNDPAAPGQAKIPEQQGNTSQPGGVGTQQPFSPGRPPMAPMHDGQSSPAMSAPGGAPPPASPAASPAAGAKQKPPRRQRKKNDKPRKTPKSMLMPSPSEAPDRAGPDDSVDVPFVLGVSSQQVEPESTARSTTRSTADG
ncbi:hypothetical protein DFR70_11747 [Nocardia tenerifensis]|uniref:Outer membrane channel protein CpnT-like N-terminal domain-containing protein n=1 Tax=Nocardia tenerifensis TaxID=228006 RepID=A0A318JV33_9NOCA|nr:hypothetical protein [Nocardia tenerifensis]PXX57619.1 hypothetical protein DFR70_11747 [Nocardia tenerifensis]